MDTKYKILIVDDEESVLKSLKRLFRNHDFEVHTQCSPLIAIETVAQTRFDLVISDMRMPGMDGAEFLTKVREITPTTERILLTGHADMESTIRAINDGGIFGFVAKPWNNDQFSDLVSAALQERHNNKLRNQALHSLKRMHDSMKTKNSEAEQALVGVEQHSRETEQALRDSYALFEEMLLNLLDMKIAGQREFAYILEELVTKVGKSFEFLANDLQTLSRSAKLHGIGKVSVPDIILAQEFTDLDDADSRIYESYPSQSACTVIAIPTYSDCAEILFKQKEACDGSGYPMKMKRDELGLVSRVFNACLDYCEARFDNRSNLSICHEKALEALRKNKARYDEKVLNKIAKIKLSRDSSSGEHTEIVLPVHSLKPGMNVAKDFYSENNVLLLRKGAQISGAMIEKLHQLDQRMGKTMMVRIAFDEFFQEKEQDQNPSQDSPELDDSKSNLGEES